MFGWIPNAPRIVGAANVDKVQVHGVCSCRMVYREIVERRSDYKKSYLWRFRNPARGDSTGSNRIEKDRVRLPPGLV